MATRITLSGLERLSAELADPTAVLTALAERARETILDEGRTDTGGDLILSHFGRGRHAGSIALDVEATPNGPSVILKGIPAGPWGLLEGGTARSYWIPRKGDTWVSFGPGEVRRYVRHGPVRAKRTFSRGVERVAAEIGSWFGEEVSVIVGRAA